MATHYEKSQLAKSGSAVDLQNRAYIDFYRQQEANQNGAHNAQRYGNDNCQEEGGIGFKQHQKDQDPSPIYSSQNQRRDMQADNFMQSTLKGHSDKSEEVAAQLNFDRQAIAKRKSIESSTAIQNARSRELLIAQDYQSQGIPSNARSFLPNAKSALGNYGSSQQPQIMGQGGAVLKQINKAAKVEKDPMMMVDQQQLYQQQQKRSLAKSQSQNKLLFVSPDALLNKGNPYKDIYDGNAQNNQGDKNSFFKDHNSKASISQPQDLLYKQHMQYSSGNAKAGWQLKAGHHNMLSRMTHQSECTFCNKTTAGAISQSQIPHHCSAIYCQRDQQGMMIQNHLSKKYSTNRDYYNLKIVNDLIYNENTHVVSIFKDYLILDDINEFLKRSYTVQETKVRLPKLCSFYDKYSQVFPNYVVLPESKYMFKNIQRKQKLIDEQYQLQEELAKKQHQTLLDEDKLFNTKFYNSYYSNMGDLSMTKKQYEDQAKQIATQAGRKQHIRGFFDQMRIDELVDRFLMKDSESNIQLITTTGLDFSGFTHQNSTFINNHQAAVPQHSEKKSTQKPITQQSAGKVQQQMVIVQQSQVKGRQPLKKASEEKKKPIVQQANLVLAQSTTNTGPKNNSRVKNSFNSTGKSGLGSTGTQQIPRLDQLKVTLGSDSAKTTPRLQQQQVQSTKTIDLTTKQTIQTSPQTKEAIQNYLANCNIEPHTEPHLHHHQHTNSLTGMGPLLSPNSNSGLPASYNESPGVKSPNAFGQKGTLLGSSGSQTSLNTNMSSNIRQSRQNLKSQCVIPTISLGTVAQTQQQMAALKKSTARLSNGGQAKVTNQHRKNASPAPGQQQPSTIASRNGGVVSNSTQKSTKSVNSHAKYLSGGNEQYQKILVGLNSQHQLHHQNSYQTYYDTLNSHLVNSSAKKQSLLPQQRSKQDLILETFVGSQNSNKKLQFHHQPNMEDEGQTVTGDDCDDFGIADERFASPDCHQLVFQTIDDNNCGPNAGRKSIDFQFGSSNAQQMLLLTSSDDKLLAQCNNYDQIKKHLEQYIGGGKGQTFDHRQSQKSSNVLTKSNEKGTYEDVKQSMQSAGYNRDNMAQSIQSNINQNSQDQSSSRNNTGQKHFESLKQKIRGVFDNQHQSDNHSVQSTGTVKTPSKGTNAHQKKANVQLASTQNLLLQNRMSLESNPGSVISNANMLLVMPTSNTSMQNHPLPLTSTSAGGRPLSFTQQQHGSFQQNAANYRSITNLQQRKGSNTKHETSVEGKRMSSGVAQHRQSFKDLGQAKVQTVVKDQQKIMKRCATGKTLSIQEINAQSGYIQNHGSGASTLCNPTFISTNSAVIPNPRMYHNATQQQLLAQQQQAANTVRVMTPSYSLASLSKMISPAGTNNTTSPITAGMNHSSQQVIGRKQVISGKGNQHIMSSTLIPSNSQQYLVSDGKGGQKLVTTTLAQSKPIISNKSNQKPSTNKVGNLAQTQLNPPTSGMTLSATLQSKIGGTNSGRQQLVQSNSLSNLQQMTPRGLQQQQQQQPLTQEQINFHQRRAPQQIQVGLVTFENSGNLSCTVSTENNSSKLSQSKCFIAAKAIESKHPKFMSTIEEYSNPPHYNNMLSATMNAQTRKQGLVASISQAQLEMVQQKQKVQTVVNSNQGTIKRQSNVYGQTLSQSASVSNFKQPAKRR